MAKKKKSKKKETSKKEEVKKKETAKKKEASNKEKVTFMSKFAEQVIVIESGKIGDADRKGKRVKFQSGIYKTSDPKEIEALREEVKNPRPGCRITEAKKK